MGAFLIDTHLWIWLQSGNTEHLKPKQVRWIEDELQKRNLFVSAVSIWEIANLSVKGKISLGTSVTAWVNEGLEDGGLQLLDLSADILIESTQLPGDLHRDPADRMLIATARQHGLTLLTYDTLILKYSEQGHLRARKL